MNKPKYAIINDTDRPCARLVAQLVDGAYCYLSRSEEPHMVSYDGMSPDRPTDIQDFGFAVLERGGVVHFYRQMDSVACYRTVTERQIREDKCVREWQDTCSQFHYKMVTEQDLHQSRRNKRKING